MSDIKEKIKRNVSLPVHVTEKIDDTPENIAKITLANLNLARNLLNSKSRSRLKK